MFDNLLYRRLRLSRYRRVRAELEAMSAADLADAGIRRYQLGAIARIRALR
jgi:uncharacterized protein YjiS (DUF1127 family)